MTLHLYDTAARRLLEFVPLEQGKVGIYVCGLTVQSEPHVGHIRSGVNFDVLRRWFSRTGYDVTYIRNVTDIDDKVLIKSAEIGRPWWAHAYFNERRLAWAYAVLGCLDPTYEPRATGHIPEMIELLRALFERGHAYEALDGSGDIYFDVQSFPEYGGLSRQRLAEMHAAEDADPRGKRDPRDCAISFSWCGNCRSMPPPWMSNSAPR